MCTDDSQKVKMMGAAERGSKSCQIRSFNLVCVSECACRFLKDYAGARSETKCFWVSSDFLEIAFTFYARSCVKHLFAVSISRGHKATGEQTGHLVWFHTSGFILAVHRANDGCRVPFLHREG